MLVVAETSEQAADAAELVMVDYDELPVVIGPLDAAADGAPVLHDGADSNIAVRKRITTGDAAAAFESAAYRVGQRMVSQRIAPVALEPRGVLASVAADGRLDVRLPTQRPHGSRAWLAKILGMPPAQIHVAAGDVGGGFGAKGAMYPDQVAVIAAARALGRPVKWIEERSESFLATSHGRDQVADLEVAVDDGGRITAMRGTVHASFGAYFTPNAPGSLLGRLGPMLPQGYQIGHFDVELTGVFANTTPIGPYRGAGRPEGAYFCERLVDLVALETGIDPAEVRRRNFVPPAHFPYTSCTGLTYDSGDYQAGLDLLLEKLAATAPQVPDGQLLGTGIASFVEPGGITPPIPGPDGTVGDKATVTISPDGKVTVAVGTSAHGQGHETAFAQLAADLLGVPYEDVTVVFGDSDTAPFGYGTFGSRSAVAGGSAIHYACQAALEAARRVDAPMSVTEAAARLGGITATAGSGAPPETYASGSYALRGGRRPGHRPGHAAADRRGRRLRRGDQPAARRGPGARRHRPGPGPGAMGGSGVRRRRPADGRLPDGLRGPVRRLAAPDRVLPGVHAVPDEPARRQGHGRKRHDRRHPRPGQRRHERPAPLRSPPPGHAAHPGENLDRHPRPPLTPCCELVAAAPGWLLSMCCNAF